ncbi:hypothetical protein DUNSADRAFT_9854 [Dunaliella salina]|uniref:Encoded protein n=1 Tax=Dunaliella salina TaxID=3046 RepID=A0ABQ7H540_DUNSA|nr:hypothetical protein DUNSADRAFT_9854 [Dunaliella salina]|eukprot:KAF5841973.1 hypothetical protein DUNSADRAFT_9854 [Dunaliella salina]
MTANDPWRKLPGIGRPTCTPLSTENLWHPSHLLPHAHSNYHINHPLAPSKRHCNCTSKQKRNPASNTCIHDAVRNLMSVSLP